MLRVAVEKDPMQPKLWNIGLTARDIERELQFLTALGATLLVREKFSGPDGNQNMRSSNSAERGSS